MVLPVPGGPTSRMPLGMRPPMRLSSSACLRKSTISLASCLASSTPSTSAKRMLSVDLDLYESLLKPLLIILM
ncbi:hypothetical protein D3C78_1346600 [compost metagenome]